jgi:ring-1,2-phenylacetyl-CoA epoxidase subunit PaaD
MVTRQDILEVLKTIDDPEMAINIVDLGLVDKVELNEDGTLTVDILPTFVGCHALPVIEGQIRQRLATLPGVKSVEVHTRYSPPWMVDRITAAGRETLRSHGIAVPDSADGDERPSKCPWCGSTSVREESPFGPTRCRTIWYCDSCRNPFEQLKRVSSAGVTEWSLGRLKQ